MSNPASCANWVFSYIPVPLRAAVCALLVALSIICKVSDFAPLLWGANLIPTVHDAPLASVLPAVQVDEAIVKSVPVTSLAELIVAVKLLELLSLTELMELEWLTFTPPKGIEVGAIVSGPGVGVGVGVGVGLGVGVGVGAGVGVGVAVGDGVGVGLGLGAPL